MTDMLKARGRTLLIKTQELQETSSNHISGLLESDILRTISSCADICKRCTQKPSSTGCSSSLFVHLTVQR